MIDRFQEEHAFLSNFYHSPFIMPDGRQYPTAEHAFQAFKSADRQDRTRVLMAATPAMAKRVGRRITLRYGWDGIRVEVMAEVLAHKFRYGNRLSMLLNSTGDEELVEGNTWGDTFWGVDVHEGGHNHLGELLMQRRRINRTIATN